MSVSGPPDRSPVPRLAPVSRRRLLTTVAGAGLATLLPAGAAAARTTNGDGSADAVAASVAAARPTPKRADAIEFFADSSLNYSALSPLAAAAYRAAEVGEVLTVFNRIHARGDSYGAYGEEFLVMARRVAARGREALRGRHRVSARDALLRATEYYAQALYYVLASNRPTRAQEARVYREMEGCFAAAARLFDPPLQRVAIPYLKRTLPGWLLTPPGARTRRPTVILTNGSDGQNIDMLVEGALATVERGWNALIYEGPGQGSQLFLHGIPFRPDWEHVVTPIVDWLRRHPGVDRRRIILTGASFGGYLVPRAAAYERRLAAIVTDPGVTNGFTSWSSQLPKSMLALLAEGRKAEFNGYWREVLPHLPATARFDVAKRAEIYGNVSFYDQMRLARQFVLTRDITRRIDAPALVTEPQDETFFPGMSATLYRWLRAPKRLERFTTAQGAQFHCEIMAPTVRNDAVLDWLQDNLHPTG